MEMPYPEVWELYETGQLDMFVEMTEDIDGLEAIYDVMKDNAEPAGVTKEQVENGIFLANRDLAFEHRLEDRDLAALDSKTMHSWDKTVSMAILRSYIKVVAGLMDKHLNKS